jgi:hypothetical protein
MNARTRGPILILATLLLLPMESWAQAISSDELYPHRRGRRVIFRIEAPEKAEVFIIGDFNDWDRYATPMRYVGDDVWEARTRLQEGDYEYKFIVDGRQVLDPSNPDEVTHRDGTVHSRIRVLADGRVSTSRRWNERDRRVPRRVRMPTGGGRADLDIGGDFSFQRVDGSTFWLRAEYTTSWDYTPEVHAQVGYGWESERWHFKGSVEQPLLPQRFLVAGLRYIDGTGYENQAGIGWGENTLAALLFKHDFRDYYDIVGIEPFGRIEFPGSNSVTVSYAHERYRSLTSQTQWSIFQAGRDSFRPNPQLYLLNDPDGTGGEGTLEAVRVEVEHDSRRARRVGTIGTYVRGFVEFGNGDFSYSRWMTDGRAYMRLGPPVHFALRAAAAGRFGDESIPSQKLFYIGGLGTVRGHEFRSVMGDHALLANAEYTLLFSDFDWGLLAFYDIGTAWNSTRQQLQDMVPLQSVGFGLKTSDNDFEVHFAKPLGPEEGDIVTSVRLQRTF